MPHFSDMNIRDWETNFIIIPKTIIPLGDPARVKNFFPYVRWMSWLMHPWHVLALNRLQILVVRRKTSIQNNSNCFNRPSIDDYVCAIKTSFCRRVYQNSFWLSSINFFEKEKRRDKNIFKSKLFCSSSFHFFLFISFFFSLLLSSSLYSLLSSLLFLFF